MPVPVAAALLQQAVAGVYWGGGHERCNRCLCMNHTSTTTCLRVEEGCFNRLREPGPSRKMRNRPTEGLAPRVLRVLGLGLR